MVVHVLLRYDCYGVMTRHVPFHIAALHLHLHLLMCFTSSCVPCLDCVLCTHLVAGELKQGGRSVGIAQCQLLGVLRGVAHTLQTTGVHSFWYLKVKQVFI